MHELGLLDVIILGIVEGITEFLPISSTGHLLLCEKWMGIELQEGFPKLFTVFIQIGAILAVVVYFRDRILALLRSSRIPFAPSSHRPIAPSLSAVWLVLLATLPVLVVGKLVNTWVESHMETPTVVALALGIGGLIMILIELARPRVTTTRIEDMSLLQAMIIGCTQILAVIFPGTSRSAATIMPAMAVGLSREAAAEFSFFLAIPAMFAASGYSLLKHRSHLDGQHVMLLLIGTLVSFLVAWVVIAAFMSFIRRRSFMPFALYRIILAAVVLWVLRN